MPALLVISCNGGSEPTIPERKSAVLPLLSLFLPLSQTVILSILRFEIALACSSTSLGSCSIIRSIEASCLSLPAELTISPKPFAFLVSSCSTPSASARRFKRVPSALAVSSKRRPSASACLTALRPSASACFSKRTASASPI